MIAIACILVTAPVVCEAHILLRWISLLDIAGGEGIAEEDIL